MNITNRIKAIDGVDFCSWNPASEKLTITLKEKADKEAVKIKVVTAITDIQLQDSVKTIDFLWG